LDLPASSPTSLLHTDVAGTITTRDDVQIGGLMLFVVLVVYLLGGRVWCNNEEGPDGLPRSPACDPCTADTVMG
jgi:hypothetical protein